MRTEAPAAFAGVTQFLDGLVERAQLPGAALHVEVEGEVVYRTLLGEASADAALPIASAAKWLTAATVLTEVDAGRLDLDEPASTWLPSFASDERKRRITCRHLLSLTHGLPRGLGTHDWSITLADHVDQISRAECVGDPGVDFRYGSLGFQVAGRIAEITSGLGWHDLFAERVAGPLGFLATTYPLRTQNPLLAGSCQSTLDDYVAFLRVLQSWGTPRGGPRVLNGAIVQDMQHNQTSDVPLLFASPQRMEQQSRYGLGSWLDRLDADDQGIEISSPGALGSRPWIDHSRSMIAVLLIQRQMDDRDLAEAAGASAHSELQNLINDAVDSS